MSLCLVNIHGDIEGDYDIIADLPRNPTNGDAIKAMFPNEVGYGESASCIYYGTMRFDKDWWNSPYRKEKE